MVTLFTEEFPYTLAYVTGLLHINEEALLEFARSLSMNPKVDKRTGNYIFTHREVELLRKALEMKQRGENMSVIVERMGLKDQPPSEALSHSPSNSMSASLPPLAPSNGGLVAGKENLAMVVEAVSQAKEGIMKDISRLLDDKLSGLDDVVVELIRCKSENDSLKKQLKDSIEREKSVQFELSRFKPVKFGFFRKD